MCGEEYLRQVYEDKWFESQKSRSSAGFLKEQAAAGKLVDRGLWEKSDLSVATLEDLLQNNLLIVSIDADYLYQTDNMSAHAVLVYDYQKSDFIFHDSAFPDGRALTVDREFFGLAVRTHAIAIPRMF